MSKNKKVMSIAIRPELHDDLKKFSKRKGLSTSAYIGNLVEQAMKLDPDDDAIVVGKPVEQDLVPLLYKQEDEVPVVLKIPVSLKNNPEKLKQWMDVQAAGIVKAMTKHLNVDE